MLRQSQLNSINLRLQQVSIVYEIVYFKIWTWMWLMDKMELYLQHHSQAPHIPRQFLWPVVQ